MRSVKQERGLQLVKDLDKLCCDANHQWHALERIKLRAAREHGVTEAMMREAGIFLEEQPPATRRGVADALEPPREG